MRKNVSFKSKIQFEIRFSFFIEQNCENNFKESVNMISAANIKNIK